MARKLKNTGLTLPEIAVVIATIVLLAGLAVPGVRALLNSFESRGGARSMISAALASARAVAARESRYAGVRFQQDLGGHQYMTFIVQEPLMMAYGFRALEASEPMRLPDSVVVMDLTVVTKRNEVNPSNPSQVRLDEPALTDRQRDDLLNEPRELTDTTTFSILFSPAGKLVVHGVRVRNRDGYPEGAAGTSKDNVFNTKVQVDGGRAMFYQDDYFGQAGSPLPDLGLGPEPSRNMFVICDKNELRRTYERGKVWSEYLATLAPRGIYINPYTGMIVSTD